MISDLLLESLKCQFLQFFFHFLFPFVYRDEIKPHWTEKPIKKGAGNRFSWRRRRGGELEVQLIWLEIFFFFGLWLVSPNECQETKEEKKMMVLLGTE